MKKTRIYVEMCVLLTCLLILWQFITIIFHIPSYYLPSPVDFFKYFIQFMQSGNMGLHITTTLYEIFIGTFWGIILGMILGYLLAKKQTFRASAYAIASHHADFTENFHCSAIHFMVWAWTDFQNSIGHSGSVLPYHGGGKQCIEENQFRI